MNLIDESYNTDRNSKKILIICGVGIVILFFILIALIAYVTTLQGTKITLKADGLEYKSSDYLIVKENVIYISVEGLTKIIQNGYSYKSGSKDVEDKNKCYITNTFESTFFEVGSDKIHKIAEDTGKVEFYTLEKPVIKENDKIYMPVNNVKAAANVAFSNQNNQIVISSINHLESVYNQPQTELFIPATSIVWETTYANKKLLKNDIAIIRDEIGNLGLGKIIVNTDNKTKKTQILIEDIITPKYTYIQYVEQFQQLIVENENGKGIVQLEEKDNGFLVHTKVIPQYEDIEQINSSLYIVSSNLIKNSTSSDNNGAEKTKRYGIINENGDTILETEYEQIGIDFTEFTNNDLVSEYVLYEKNIPVKKDGLWGFVNLDGKVLIKLEYSSIGCISKNPSSNVVIIPELNAIVVKKDGKYSIINSSGKVLIKNTIESIYKESLTDKEVYTMILNNKKYNVIEYINSLNNNTNENRNNNTNTTNTNRTNTTNTTNTNKTNATNTNKNNTNKNNTNKNNTNKNNTKTKTN